jgi:hypothetical protein
MMALRSKLIQWALWLQFAPFTWLFHAYYRLAVLCSRWLVGRVEGVRSIYLTGSLARNSLVYGLSDIDFKIFISGYKDPSIYQSVLRRFHHLRRIFPMLGSPDEKGIYFLQSFESDYSHYPLVQHLFDERFFKHKLIFGDDILPNLPIRPWQELGRGETVFGRIKDWIERVHLLADSDVLCLPQKQHLFYKAVCDIGLLAIRTRDSEYSYSQRSEILCRILPEMEHPYRQLIENLILENQICYRRQLNSHEENFQLFKQMVAFCSEAVSSLDRSACSDWDVHLGAIHCAPEDPVIASTLQNISPKIRSVRGIRWPQLPLNPFDVHLYNSLFYLVDCSGFLSLSEFHDLKDFCRTNLKGKGRVLLLEDSKFLSSVDADLIEHWGSFSGSSDLMYLLLGKKNPKILSMVEQKRIETRTRSFLKQLASILANPRFGRMDLSLFPSFLFNALRVMIFHNEFVRGKWQWAITPGETAEFLIRRTCLSPRFVGKLEQQYKNCFQKGSSFDERMLPKCRDLLREMLEISLNGGTSQSLEKINSIPDEQALTISVAVVTSDRSHQLKRCLDSLTRLSRLPEELIIVDSGRDPLAPSTVEQYQSYFPIRYLCHEKSGVASARNIAVQAAKGEIITFVDDDVSVEPEWLQRIERVFLRDPQIGLAAGAILNMECSRNDTVWKFMEAVEKI